MPSLDVKQINLSNGISIVTSSRGTLTLAKANFPTGNLASVESKVNIIIQGWFEDKIPLSQIPSDDPIKNNILLSNERIESNQLITITMYVKIHIYTLSPLGFQIRCSAEPIPSDWWVGLQ